MIMGKKVENVGKLIMRQRRLEPNVKIVGCDFNHMFVFVLGKCFTIPSNRNCAYCLCNCRPVAASGLSSAFSVILMQLP